jgi:hypothetical protein
MTSKPTDGSLDETLLPAKVSGHGDTITDTHSDAPVSSPTYKLGELLGRGGMGEVMLADDIKIGRQVAVKRMRSTAPSAEATARFLREAKIQARLDHPAIVPVHELGTDADGRPFFTMKRLEGITLAEVLKGKESLQRLLRVFAEVCQAIEFAHARGVIHRDLKPANIMLGRYGEVYVLDWGVARVVGETDSAILPEIESLSGDTQVGAVLGTPGYMSPEQVRGEPVTPATDVYALGAILFEIVAAEPVHPPGHAALVSTLSGDPEGPSKRAPDRAIPPELEKACSTALSFEAAARPTAAALAAEIQRYLDGDRDLAKRRALAAEHLAAAREDIASGDPTRRADAIGRAGRAIGLDPDSDAAALIGQLMIEPPKHLPAELAVRLERMDDGLIAAQSKRAASAMTAYFAMFPVLVWMGVRDWQLIAIMFALVFFNIGMALKLMSYRYTMVILTFSNALLILTSGRIFGPFIYVPMLFIGVSVAMISSPTLMSRPWLVISTMVTGYLAPIVLEGLGLWERTWNVANNQFTSKSSVVDLEKEGVALFLVVAGCILLTVMPMFVRSMAIAQREARRRVEIQVWHLEQLLRKNPGAA